MDSPSTPPETIGDIVQALRDTFTSEVTYSLKWRVQQLKNLKRMLVECTDELCEGMYKDLHRSKFEGKLYDIDMLFHEIQFTLDHLADWMEPTSVPTDISNLPGRSYIRSEPLGVAAIIAPWNYPCNLLFTPLIGALAGGNTAILRPAHFTVHTTAVIAKIIPKYFDAGVVSVVCGDRNVTTALLEHRFDIIFFTGGTLLGKVVATAAAKHLTPIILELGGKSPAIVDKDADLDVAAKRLVWSSFLNAGQTCVCVDYIMAHQDIQQELIAKMKECIKKFYVFGDDPSELACVDAAGTVPLPPLDNDTGEIEQSPFFGRIVNGGGAFERITGLINADRKYIVEGGQSREETRYVAPTILDFKQDFDAFKSSASMEREIFGPIVPVVAVATMKQAIDYVREHEKPLALYCYCSNAETKEAVATRTSSGSLVFNDGVNNLANYHLPFGGVGMSGMGAYHGKESFRAFSHQKAILYKYAFGDFEARYPPYTLGKQKVLKLVSTPIPRRTANILRVSALVALIAIVAVVCKEYALPAIWPSFVKAVSSVSF